jgi:hypothetical protein
MDTAKDISMRRALLLIPLVIPIVFHRLYEPINRRWTVEVFGCGCPPMAGGRHFNANDFNLIVWIAIALGCGVMWWRFARWTFKIRHPFFCTLLRGGGLMAVLAICSNRFAQEIWL